MSKSLRLVNGDLSINNRQLSIVSGQDKLIQDLTLWIREKIGTDPMTPNFGSILDGGIINGQEVTPFIGQVLNPQIQLSIRSEILNLLNKYQQMQLQKMKTEAVAYQGKNTLSRDEVIYSIDSVDVTNIGTTVLVQSKITTLAGVPLSITLPLSG